MPQSQNYLSPPADLIDRIVTSLREIVPQDTTFTFVTNLWRGCGDKRTFAVRLSAACPEVKVVSFLYKNPPSHAEGRTHGEVTEAHKALMAFPLNHLEIITPRGFLLPDDWVNLSTSPELKSNWHLVLNAVKAIRPAGTNEWTPRVNGLASQSTVARYYTTEFFEAAVNFIRSAGSIAFLTVDSPYFVVPQQLRDNYTNINYMSPNEVWTDAELDAVVTFRSGMVEKANEILFCLKQGLLAIYFGDDGKQARVSRHGVKRRINRPRPL